MPPAIASTPTRADNAVTMKTTKRPRKAATAPGKAEGLAGFHIRAERLAAGKALRQRVPRESHGDWRPPRKARDPVEILERSNRGRLPELVPIRYGRMVRTPFTFLRGSAALMAHDLATTPTTGIEVQACGDCHLLNFGAFATPGAEPGLRPQRLRRDAAGAVGMGPEAPGRELPDRGTRQSPVGRPTVSARSWRACARIGSTCASARGRGRWTSGTSGWTRKP